MNDKKYDELWDKLVKNLKIAKIKAIRTWHRLDKKFAITRKKNKLILATGFWLVSSVLPNAQVSLHAQNVRRKAPAKRTIVTPAVPSKASQLLAKANTIQTEASFTDFMDQYRDYIVERQIEFATTYWDIIQQNNIDCQNASARGGKRAQPNLLRQRFKNYKKDGLTIDPQYFCATGALGSYAQAIDSTKFEEYKILFECLTNPNSCSQDIKDFKKHFGNKQESSNIAETLAEIHKKDPYAICICFPHSKSSRSGYHYVTVFSNAVAVDTLMTSGDDAIGGKVASFNRTKITDINEYFSGSKSRGYVFNLTEMIGNYQMFYLYMKFLEERKIKPIVPEKKYEDGPIASIDLPEKKETSWREISLLPKEDVVSLPQKKTKSPVGLARRGGRNA